MREFKPCDTGPVIIAMTDKLREFYSVRDGDGVLRMFKTNRDTERVMDEAVEIYGDTLKRLANK